VAVWHGDPATNVSEIRNSAAPAVSDDLKRELTAFTARVKQPFTKAELLYEAVTHPSVDAVSNQKRLAALGEVVANETLVEFFFQRYPNLPYHSIRSLRNHLQSLATVANVGRKLGIHHIVNIKLHQGAKVSDKAVVDTFYAVTAGILLDQGSKPARDFVRDFLLPELDGVDVADFVRLAHPKSLLAQLLKDSGQEAPSHKLVKESGRLTHLPTFVVAVFSGSKLLAEGASYSIKTAELEAYRTALRTHFGETYKNAPLPLNGDDVNPKK